LIGIKLEVKPAGAGNAQLPGDTEAKTLARESLLAFHRALQTKSFVAFYGQIAPMWQKQTTAQQLQQQFQQFIDGKISLASVAKAELTFEPAPAIDEDGVLQINGSSPLADARLRFSLSYLFEETKWKLVGINVRIVDADEGGDE
jgi:hypothetical protein